MSFKTGYTYEPKRQEVCLIACSRLLKVTPPIRTISAESVWDNLYKRRHRGASLGSTSGIGVYPPLSPGILWREPKKCFKIPTKVVTEAFIRRGEGNAFMALPILCIRYRHRVQRSQTSCESEQS